MISTILGYGLGIIFAAGIYLTPIGLFGYESYYVYHAVTNSTLKEAEVVKCHYKWRRKSSSSGAGSWAPVAKTLDGEEVIGRFRWRKKKWCESDIGDKVSVFVSSSSSKKSQINTFMQLWFLPLIYGIITFLLYSVSVKNILKKRNAKKNT